MDADEAMTHCTLKSQGMRLYPTPTHHPSPFASNFPGNAAGAALCSVFWQCSSLSCLISPRSGKWEKWELGLAKRNRGDGCGG